MTAMLSTEFWIVFQLTSLLLLISILVFVVRNVKKAPGEAGVITEKTESDPDSTAMAANRIIALLEPLLNEAESAARIFESQIMEKKILIRELNEKLDSRIISLNLLLNRADACLSSKATGEGAGISDMQEAILSMFTQGMDAAAISGKLSVPLKEVDLVIGLKKKFIAMENEA
jgi:hypothetical protein